MFFVYILQSVKDKGLYVGLSGNVKKRVSFHNAGHVRSTKHRAPFLLIHTEKYETRKEARLREKYLKSYSGVREKLEIVERHELGPIV